MAVWAASRIRLDGRPFRFAEHEYLKAIYDDTSQHVVLSKAAQIGGTTFAVLRSVHACIGGLSVVYFFPTRTDVLDFSKSRVSPLLAENRFLAEAISETDTAGLKRIGEGYMYMRGMQSTIGMKSVPADLLVFDELDESEPNAKAMAKERLAHSDYKRIIELSNPSFPDYGIDEQFQKSDQRHWTLKCPACGRWTAPVKEFPIKLGQEVTIIRPSTDGTYYLACPQCGGALDIAAGEWVADFPGRSIHGYRISQLFSSKISPGEILDEYQTTHFPDRFYNLKIGIPWTDREHGLDAMSVLSLCTDTPQLERIPRGSCVMGVDTGKHLHVVIIHDNDDSKNCQRRVVHVAICREFSELDRLMELFNVRRCVIDGLPEIHSTRDFTRRFPHRAFQGFFNEHQHGGAKWDDKAMIVHVNRTEALDASRMAIRNREVLLPRRLPQIEEFALHMTRDAKRLEEDPETGSKRYKYIRIGENHFSMAFTYVWMATSVPIKWAGVWGV